MEDIGAAVERILSNPEFARAVRDLGGGDGGDLMSRLPEVMAALGPVLDQVRSPDGNGDEAQAGNPPTAGNDGETEDGGPARDRTEEGPVPAVIGKKPFGRSFRRSEAERLFLALKPYLGDRRRGIVDRCMTVMRMGELLKAAGGPDSPEGGRSGS